MRRSACWALGVLLFAVAPAWADPCGTSYRGKYYMAFLGCNHALFNCMDPFNHEVYLAESQDGAAWSLVPGWVPYQGSVPDIIRRGRDLYIYTPGQVRRYRGNTGTWEPTVPVMLNDPQADSYVDPSLIIDGQGRLVMFYLLGIFGQDPAQCAPGQTSCTKFFHSATETPGSDGTEFDVNPGDRAAITIGVPDSASDPEIYSDFGRFVLYISRGASVQALTSTSLHGVYTPVPALPGGFLTNRGGVPAGHFDPRSARYWTFVQSGDIYRATHATLDAPIPNQDFFSVVNPVTIGLGPDFEIGSPSFALNAPTVAPEVFDLSIEWPGNTIAWAPFPNATSYDLIRGDLSSLACTTDHVDLGTVMCIADNLPATSIGNFVDPALGQGFFFLVRPNLPTAKGTYGHSLEGGEEVPSSGGCP